MKHRGLLIFSISLLLTACAAKSGRDMSTTNLPTHNPAVFKEGRYCNDYLKFQCLPESRDPTILQGNGPLVDGKYPFYEYDEKKYNNLVRINNMEDKERIAKMEHYVLTPADYKWMDQARISQWYTEMEEKMEKQYPGFWGETPRPVRHRWMRLCVAKGMSYGYGIKAKLVNDNGEEYDHRKDGTIDKNGQEYSIYNFISQPILDANGKRQTNSNGIRSLQQFIELCGRIGLYFDNEPRWQYIVDFIKINKDGATAGMAVEYIDFTIYKKDYSRTGNKFTDWWLRDALRHLPRPSRHLPSINDPE